MSIIEKLASTVGRRDKEPNKNLAKEIAVNKNHTAIKKLVENLKNKEKNIQSNCIKVLYETGYIEPELIASYHKGFISLLKNKNNRLIWGSMIALDTIASIKLKVIFNFLPEIVGKEK